MQTHCLDVFQKQIMKIDQIVAGISTFEVLGSKWNILLPGTSSKLSGSFLEKHLWRGKHCFQ